MDVQLWFKDKITYYSNQKDNLMLAFGHTGLTLGIAALINGVYYKRHQHSGGTELETVPSPKLSSDLATPGDYSKRENSWITYFITKVDTRILLAGSLLPDIIDKPLGHLLFRNTLGSGRAVSHTLLFFLVIALIGLYRYKSRGKTGILILSFGTFTHLVFDQMWRSARTLFWPVYGFAFERTDISNWLPNMWQGLLSNPQVYIPEILGLVILAWIFILTLRKGKFSYLLKH